jgi:hypothetical protein
VEPPPSPPAQLRGVVVVLGRAGAVVKHRFAAEGSMVATEKTSPAYEASTHGDLSTLRFIASVRSVGQHIFGRDGLYLVLKPRVARLGLLT